MHVYICAYKETAAGSGGIYHFDFDPGSGTLAPIGKTTDGIERASFLAINGEETIVILADERTDGQVHAYSRDYQNSALMWISTQPTEGADPCYVSFDPEERHALLTNYTGGNFVALEIDGSGTLGPARSYRHNGSGPMASRQEVPHPHMIAPNPVDGQIYVSDLGIDQVVAYVFDPESGDLVPPPAGAIKAVLKPGAGPRHFVFDETGNRLYVIGELDSTVTFFERQTTGDNWNAVQTISTLPADFKSESTCAQILRSADGRFLYGSNRGHDSIAIFGIDQASGRLTALGHESTRGRTPRNFNIDPTGTWLFAANQDSDTVVLFQRDADSGRLTVSGDPIRVPMPMCVAFAGE